MKWLVLPLLALAAAGPAWAADCRTAQVREHRALAIAGDAAAQWALADALYYGIGVPPDPVAAAKWYRRAAEQGVAQAQNNLGLLYAIGEGVPRDRQAARTWLSRAAAQGDPLAGANLERLDSGIDGFAAGTRPRLRSEVPVCDSVAGTCGRIHERSLLAFDGPPGPDGRSPMARFTRMARCP